MSDASSTSGSETDADGADSAAQQQSATTGTQQQSADTGDGTDWKAMAEQAKADAEKWKGLARRHEERAKSNADAASKAKTVEEQMAELRKALSDRDVADVQRAGKLAVSQVHAALAEARIPREDVAGLLELVDPTTLLADGEPDDKAIEKLAKSLTRIAGRATPDRDQGRKGGDAPADMNTIIRRAAGIPI